jgi:hypothetical protein
MNEDSTAELTKDMSDSEKLAFIVAELIANREWQADLSARMTKVETFVEERSRETRPILELILKEVADLSQSVKEIRIDLKLLHEERWKEKRERAELEARVTAVENRPH